MSPLHAYDEPRYWGRRVLGIVALLLALAAAGYAGSVLGPHFSSSSASTTTTTTHRSTTTTTIAHAKVTVQVANGTQEQNAAAHFSQVLQQQGWSVSTPVNATSSASATTVYYGAFFMQSASEIAAELGVPATSLQPLTSTTPIPSTSGVDVAVVIGPDLAGSGFPATTATT